MYVIEFKEDYDDFRKGERVKPHAVVRHFDKKDSVYDYFIVSTEFIEYKIPFFYVELLDVHVS